MAVTEWVHVGDEAELAGRDVVRVEVADVPVAIWRVDGSLYATADTCTHEEASLSEGDLWDEVIECPLHGAQFDVRTGKVLSLPAIFPLPTYPVEVRDGGIYVGWATPE